MIVRTMHRMMGLILVVLLAASACGGSTAPAAESPEVAARSWPEAGAATCAADLSITSCFTEDRCASYSHASNLVAVCFVQRVCSSSRTFATVSRNGSRSEQWLPMLQCSRLTQQ